MNKEKVDCCELNTDNEYPILTMPDAEEDTNQMKKKKTAVSFGADEHIPPPVLDQDIWEKVDTEEEEEESQETSYKPLVSHSLNICIQDKENWSIPQTLKRFSPFVKNLSQAIQS